jgi:hypothetical protein
MEMVGKQFSPFMGMIVQQCLTAYATMSYKLLMEMVGKQFSPFM